MATAGPKYPGTVAQISGDYLWTNLSNWASTTAYASIVSLPDAATTASTAKLSNFGFTHTDVPFYATITDISVVFTRYQSFGAGVREATGTPQVMKLAGAVGTADPSVVWPASGTARTITGLRDEAWSPSDIVDAGFGYTLRPINATGDEGNANIYARGLNITVTLDLPPAKCWGSAGAAWNPNQNGFYGF